MQDIVGVSLSELTGQEPGLGTRLLLEILYMGQNVIHNYQVIIMCTLFEIIVHNEKCVYKENMQSLTQCK